MKEDRPHPERRVLDRIYLRAFSAFLGCCDLLDGIFGVLLKHSQTFLGLNSEWRLFIFNKYIIPCESFKPKTLILFVVSLSLRLYLRRCFKISCIVGLNSCRGLDS